MPDQSTLLSLPYIQPSQAQKHVTHNEAIRLLDWIVQLSVPESPNPTPPAAPVVGDRFIVGSSATGVWAGHDNSIAVFEDTGWLFITPNIGWVARNVADNSTRMFDGTNWVKPTLKNLDGVGIGTSWDATNRFALSSDASLFNNAGNGHQLKINKANAGDSATCLFQNNWSGRAEIGLSGDDDLHFKVSADGGTWFEAMIVDRASGIVSFPSGGVRDLLQSDRTYFVDAGAGNDTNDGLTSGTAFATIQHAIDVCSAIDGNGHTLTIQLADGTYSGNLAFERPLAGGERLKIQGNAVSPQNTVITAAVGATTTWKGHVKAELRDVQLENSGSTTLIDLSEKADLYIGNIIFKDATSSAQIALQDNSLLTVVADYSVSGSAQKHILAKSNAVFKMSSQTITVSGGPNFSVAFAEFDTGASYVQNGSSWSGAATGKRYDITMNATCKSDGVAHFPGDIAGTTSAGGQYSV